MFWSGSTSRKREHVKMNFHFRPKLRQHEAVTWKVEYGKQSHTGISEPKNPENSQFLQSLLESSRACLGGVNLVYGGKNY